jgi:RNA-directed DNA polymerase
MPRQSPTQHWQINEAQINAAYQWLCQQRKHFPANADIWDFRVTWASRKAN